MAPDERRDEDYEEPLRVTDRRRFTESGDVRQADAAEEPSEGGASPAEAGAGLPPPETGELGIATVFLAFWQGALMNLGVADADGQRLPVNLDAARESIELLRVLQSKTSGNLTTDEDRMLRELLHQAQLAYVQVAGGGEEGKP